MPVSRYKKAEEAVAARIASGAHLGAARARGILEHILRQGKRRFTIMVVPQSGREISSFHVPFFMFAFVALVLGVVLAVAVVLASGFFSIHARNTGLVQRRADSAAALTRFKDEIAALRGPARRLKAGIDGVLAAERPAAPAVPALIAASFTSTDSARADVDGARDLSDLKSLTGLLNASRSSVDRTARVLSAFRDLMAATPTTWPLRGGVGVITTRFGWTTNPFTKQGYMHLGVDIAWAMGTPIVATADGTVLQVGRSADLGNFVIIQHKYGYSTRYSHLNAFADKRAGDRVSRGEVIGYLGTTGLSTGPHLDYVVRLGSSYINPIQFLAIRPEISPMLAAYPGGSD